tara:strand:- start:1100 stop:1597 length:498 start_codon:yes stop_codon:yes gene_type:complete
MSTTRKLLMTAGGTGLVKVAPGTWGSVPPVIIAFLLGLTGEAWVVDWAMVLIVILSCWICVGLGPWAEECWGCKDPQQVVIDEVAGQALTLLLLPWMWILPSTQWLAISCGMAFAAFRIFDILKPLPIRSLQRYPKGWGVLLDDLAAAIPAAILCWILLLLLMPS